MTAQGNSGEGRETRYEVADLFRDIMGLGSQAEELLERAKALLENPDVEFPGAARRNTVAEFADLALTVVTGLDSLAQQASLTDQVQLRKAMIRLLAKIDPV